MRKRDRDADTIRRDLAKLRERYENGAIDATEHAHRSARLLEELKRIGEGRPRYALT